MMIYPTTLSIDTHDVGGYLKGHPERIKMVGDYVIIEALFFFTPTGKPQLIFPTFPF
jgi:hypothetical protein